ncbi:MAG: ECF transporter S component [Candidatus Nanoarchaeia archaeon]
MSFENKNKFIHNILNITDVNYTIYVILFTLGSLLFPFLAHNLGVGRVLLPIYFFVIIGTYRFGWKVGLATAVLAPLLNYFVIGMPAMNMLPFILVKGALIVALTHFILRLRMKLSIVNLIGIVLGYQILGTAIEFFFTGNMMRSLTDFRIGYFGLIFQIVGGYLFLRYVHLHEIISGNTTKN